MAQIQIEPGNPSGNLGRIAAACGRLRSLGADWVLFPECSDTGWGDDSCLELADVVPGGRFYSALRHLAMEHHLFLTCGLTRRSGRDIFNSAVTIDAHGNLLHLHDKIHELDFVHHLYAQGGSLATFATPFGRAGVMICADGFAGGSTISTALGYMGVDFILSPCAWAVPPDHDNRHSPYGKLWEDSYGAAAAKFGIFIAGVSGTGVIRSGEWRDHRCIGCSMLTGPDGEVIYKAPYGGDSEDISVHRLRIVRRTARGTQWDEDGNRGL
jgi:predicted amidohydrolase